MCDGQLLVITQNTALFSLLGTTYGGDGRTTFGLPNLQGAAALHPGQGNGLSTRYLGESSGSDYVTLITSEIPSHNHIVNAISNKGGNADPTNSVFANAGNLKLTPNFYASSGGLVTMSPFAVSPAGGDQPHNNLMPYLTMIYCIALQGVYPPRT